MTDLSMYRGDDRTLEVVTDVPDLSGSTLRFTAKYHSWDADEDAVITKLAPDVTATGGTVSVDLEPADTADLVGTAVLTWDVQAVTAGKVRTLDSGTLRVTPDISRTVP